LEDGRGDSQGRELRIELSERWNGALYL